MNEIESLMRLHINAAVEARAREIEAFILAQLRVTGLNPVDVQLVERHSADGTITMTVEAGPSAPPTKGKA